MSGTILDLIRKNAEHAPDTPAIGAPRLAPMSYGRLLSTLLETGEKLKGFGIGPCDRVAIVLPNGPCAATAFLGVASCATAAPLNPAYQESELDFYLTDSKAAALIIGAGKDQSGQEAARNAAKRRGISIIELHPSRDEAGVFALREVERGKRTGPAPQGPGAALVLHTSGTTSRPKLVPLTQSNLLASAANIARSLRLEKGDRCLNVMPLFHIHGLVGALLSSIASGGAVHCTEGAAFPAFFDWLEALSPTWYTAVPTIHQAILSYAGANRDGVRHRLRLIRSSSSALARQTMEGLETLFGAPVIEAYGMTEASHQMASNPLPPARRKPGSVGLAAGPQIAIMDAAGKLLGPSMQGEVVIQGSNVMQGYEGNAEANLASFVNGWFRTGDRGYLDEEGYLFLVGRIKEIINRAGEKVSPREVDEALLAYPAVSAAVAFAMPHPTLGEDVAAAVVLKDGANATEAELRDFLSRGLAPFKVPQRIVFLDEIPKGATGKVQRIGLYDRLKDRFETGFEEPTGEIEVLIARAWKEILGVAQVGASDNFFSLGGDSLHGMRVIARARELGLLIEPQMLFQKPTLADLAAVARRALPGKSPAKGTAPRNHAPRTLGGQAELERLGVTPSRWAALIKRYEAIQCGYPILPGQLELCPTERRAGEPCHGWLGQVELEIAGNLKLELFRNAWEECVGSHDATRAAFDWEPGAIPLKLVCPGATLLWEEQDWHGSPPELVDQDLERMGTRELREGFEPGRPPHLRVAVFVTDSGARVLISHWVPSLDTWSALQLLKEALARYRASERGAVPPAISDDVHADYIEAMSRSEELDVSRRESHLSGLSAAPRYPWNLKEPRPGLIGRFLSSWTDNQASTSRIALSKEESGRIRDWARGHRFHLNAVLQGAFAHELARHAPAMDIILLNTASGRFASFPGMESLIGSTFEVFPIRLPPARAAAPVESMSLIQEELTQDVRSAGWRAALGKHGISRSESLPIWHYASLPELELSTDHVVRGLRSRVINPASALQITAVPGAEIELILTGTLDQSDPGAGERLLAGFVETLRSAISAPFKPGPR